MAAGPELQFEGTGCLAGPSTTRSFTVPVRVSPALVGQPLRFRAEPLPGDPFVGVRATSVPASQFLACT